MKQKIETDDAPKPPILSQAIVSNGLIFVSGQVHNNPDGTLVEGTTEEKLALIMKNIEAILKAAGAGLDDIVKVTIFLTDMSILPDLNKVYPSYFSDPLPTREAIGVAALPLGASIEVCVIATKNV